MKLKLLKLLSLIILFLSAQYTYWYSYQVNDSTYTIDNTSKIKVDQFFTKNILSSATAKKYKTALNKINPLSVANNKRPIYYYLKYKVLGYLWENNVTETKVLATPPQVVVTETKKVANQKPINTLINVPDTSISNSPRTNTINSLSDSNKEYIETLRSYVKDYVEVDSNYEFTEYWNSYRVKLSEFYQIKFSIPVKSYIDVANINNQILIKKWWVFLLSSWGYSIEKKYYVKNLVWEVKFSWYGTWISFFEERNWIYYMYSLYDYKYYEIPNTWIFLSQMSNISSLSNNILIQKDSTYQLVSWQKEVKLFDTSLLSSVENPLLVLRSIWKDYYFYKTSDINSTINNIRNKTLEITKDTQSDKEKITAIYSWITTNITYDDYTTKYIKEGFSEETYLSNVNKAIFSWLETYNNKSWVCDWYSKLMQYMLNFVWIDNVSIQSWNADVGKWQLVAHARVKIDNLYYDPTWDIYSKWIPGKFKRFALTRDEMWKTHFPQ